MNCECIYNYQWAGSLSFMRKTRIPLMPKSHWVALCSSKKLWPIRSSFDNQGCTCRLVSDWLKFEHVTRYFEAITTQNEFVLFKKKKVLCLFLYRQEMRYFFPLTHINKLTLNANARQIVTWTMSQWDLMIWLLIGWKSAQNFEAII